MYVYESISIQNSRIYVDIRPAAVAGPRERRRARFIKHISQNHRPIEPLSRWPCLPKSLSYDNKFPSQMRCAHSNCIVAPNRRRQVYATLCSYTVTQETLCKGISFSSERVNSVLILCLANVTYKMEFHFFFQHSDLRSS